MPSAREDLVSNQVEVAWLTRYPLLSKVILYRKNEFLTGFREIIIDDCNIIVKPITSRSLQANAI